jgi:hypothetical protein
LMENDNKPVRKLFEEAHLSPAVIQSKMVLTILVE